MTTRKLILFGAMLALLATPVAFAQLAPARGTPAKGGSAATKSTTPKSGTPVSASKSGSPTSAAGTSSGGAPALGPQKTIEVESALVTLIEDVKVPATEMGMLTKIHVVEGQAIEEGALLADIDNRETIAKQLIGQGELDAALAQAESDAELIVAQKAVEVAKAELDSQKEIRNVNPGAVSLTEIRKYQFQLERALAQVKLAETDRHIASLTAKTKEAQLQALDIELDRRQVKAPFPGEVVEIFRKRGEWVQAGEPVMHIARLDKCRIKGFVLATVASPHELRGRPVEIVLNAPSGKELYVKGVVGYVSEIIEGVGSSRQFRIWADVDNHRLTDEVTKQQYWAIQPGSMAKMSVDVSAPAPKAEPAGPRLTPVRNETRKPVAGDEPDTRER